MVVKGTVVRIFDFGVFIQLEEGVDAFARREDISWARHLKSPKKLLKVGDTVEGKITSILPAEKKIGISLKEVLENPWQNASKKYRVGERIKGKVVKVINTGAFVQLDQEIDGYIHVDNISWTKRYRKAEEYFKEGMEVEAVITEMDVDKQRINLSIKHFSSNPWEVFDNKHNENSIVKGKIVRVSKAGVAVALEDGLEGFIPRREIPREKEEKMEENFKVGEEISAVVNGVRTEEQKIDLSLKRYDSVLEHKEMEKFISTDETSTEKMGSFFKNLKPLGKE
jgi:small subunit ribosomal protein S1